MSQSNNAPGLNDKSLIAETDDDKPYPWGYGSTPRTAQLRDALYWKAAVVKDWQNVSIGLGKVEFREGIKVDMDRARIVTEAFRQTEGSPPVLQYAAMVEKLLDEMPIFIKPGELIVGDPNGAPDEVRWYPETNVDWMPEAVTSGGFSEMVTEDQRREILTEICAYWSGKSISDRIKASLPKDMSETILAYSPSYCGHIWQQGRLLPAYDYEVLFQHGLKARIDTIEAKLRELDNEVEDLDPGEYLSRRHNWEAQAGCGRAMIRYAGRLADLARKNAKDEGDEKARNELETIASTLEWVPANPPRTFRECLQFYWIVETTAHYLTSWGNGSGTRLDQVWWPYFQADKLADRINREQAMELVECLMIKIQEVGAPLEWPFGFTGGSGAEVFCTSNICGTKPDGSDASNELSCIIMEALANLRLTQPPIALRYHRNISDEVVDQAIDLCRLGLGHPSFFNEDLLEQWALDRGWSAEEAKKVQVAGCVAPNIRGKAIGFSGVVEVGAINLVGILAEVLHNHSEPLDCGPIHLEPPKAPAAMSSSDELLEAVMDRAAYYARVCVVSWNLAQQQLMDYRPDPCNSFLLDEPMERGVDLRSFNKEGDTWPNIIPFGAMNAADSLAAIQRLVFEEKKYDMKQLEQALLANWVGHEQMHQEFLHAPKFGNDDDEADAWAVKLQLRLNETLAELRDAWGNSITMDGSVATGYAMYGMANWASPDGRLATVPLADGTRSPVAGRDAEGPTAALKSAGKIPYLHPDLFNQRFMPEFLEGDNKKTFSAYLRAWYDTGTIPHIQFNVVSSDILRDAQQHPEKHASLIVRVAGYSAHFIDLPDTLQNSIIDRVEQTFHR